MIFLRQLINSTNKQVLWGNKSNLLPKHQNQHENYLFIWKNSLHEQINFSKSKVRAWKFHARLFFLLYRKIIIVLLKYILHILERTRFFFFPDKNALVGRWVLGFFLTDKKERERWKRWQPKRRKKHSHFFFYTWNYVFIFSLSFFLLSWKMKLFFLVEMIQKPSYFKNYEIFFIFSF
jgi:hypothetical protein